MSVIGGELDDPRQEAYARGRALGMAQHEAHKAAGYTGKRGAASALETRSEPTSNGEYKAIRERIREIQQHALTLADITPEVIMTRVWHVTETAKSDAVKLKGLELLGKAHGMWIERSQTESVTYDVAACLKAIAGDNPEMLKRLAKMIPLLPSEKEKIG